jgi:hypothetical protein
MTTKLLLGMITLTLIASAAQETEQPMPAGFTSLAAAKLIEIKDASGQRLLQGAFQKEDEDKDSTEFEAALIAFLPGSKAKGKAEIEVKTSAGAEQELELDLDRLPASTELKIFMDGKEFATIMTDKDGDADLKFTTKKQ